MKAVITGITGFAGSYLAETLLAAGDQVFGLVHHDHRPTNLPAMLTETVPLETWDMTQPASPQLHDVLAQWQPDCCYHLAAMSTPADCGTTTPNKAALASNVTGTQHVVDLITALPQSPRLLFTSSNHVYAAVDADQPIVDENAQLAPDSAYGKTKLAAESIVSQAVQSQQLDACIARSFQHTGPRQQPQMMVPEWARQFAQDANTICVQSLDSYLDLSDVRDVVRAYRAIMQLGPTGAIFNVGTGTAIRSGEVCEFFQQLVSRRRQIKQLKPGKRQHPIANINQLQNATNWQPEINIAATVEDTLHYWIQKLACNP